VKSERGPPGSGPGGLAGVSRITSLDSGSKNPGVLKAVEALGFDGYKIDYSPSVAVEFGFASD